MRRLQALRTYLSGDPVKTEAAAAVQAARKADHEDLAAEVSCLSILPCQSQGSVEGVCWESGARADTNRGLWSGALDCPEAALSVSVGCSRW